MKNILLNILRTLKELVHSIEKENRKSFHKKFFYVYFTNKPTEKKMTENTIKIHGKAYLIIF